MNINEFKPGDIITRTEPIMINDGYNDIPDESLIGKKFTLGGIANGCVYLKMEVSEMGKMMGALFGIKLTGNDVVINLPLYSYSEGWEKWKDPNSLFNEDNMVNLNDMFMNNIQNESELKMELQKALDNEDYERASLIQKALNMLNSNKKS